MEPFEISLTFMRVLGKERNKKTQHRNSFGLYWGERSLGIQNQAALFKCLSVCLLIYLGSFLYILCFLCRTLKRENVIYLLVFLVCPVWRFPTRCHMRLQIVACRLFLSCFGMVEALLSLTSPLGTNLRSLKTSGCNKTWSDMQHRHAPRADGGRKNLPCDEFALLQRVQFPLRWDLFSEASSSRHPAHSGTGVEGGRAWGPSLSLNRSSPQHKMHLPSFVSIAAEGVLKSFQSSLSPSPHSSAFSLKMAKILSLKPLVQDLPFLLGLEVVFSVRA